MRGDICDGALVEQTLDRYGVDTIVNFAAESHVDRSIMEPDAFMDYYRRQYEGRALA